MGPSLRSASLLVAAFTLAQPLAAQTPRPLAGQVAMVTGSTSGLGRVLAFRLSELGAEVIVHGRNADAGGMVVDSIRRAGGRAAFYRADLGSREEVRDLATAIRTDYRRLDLLISNAGVGPAPDQRLLSRDGLELRFHVNYLAGVQLTRLLLPLLQESAPAQIVFVASRTQRDIEFDDVMLESGFSGGRAYAQSKLAQIMFTFDLAPRLRGSGIRVNAVHPAPVMDTRMMEILGAPPQTTPEDGAASVLNVVKSQEGWTGMYFHEMRPARARDQAYDPDARRRLMEVTNRLLEESRQGDLLLGSRSFEREVALEDSAATSANVSIGDLDGDGHLDVLLVKGRHWPLDNLVLLGDGTGSFAAPYPLGGTPDRSYSGVLADLDGDGDLDVVVSNDDPDEKRIHLNNGSGRFTLASTFGSGAWPTRHVDIVDLNGDGALDAVMANRYGPDQGPSFVCLGTGSGGFRDECMAVSIGSATTITHGDFDGDGSPDLVVPHRDGGQGYILLNDGSGAFRDRRPFGPPRATIRSARPADLDGDGLLDLAVIDERTGPGILHARSDGGFDPPVPLGDTSLRPYALVVADVDGNGRPDVIVGYVEARPVVFFNDGEGVFQPVPFGDAEGAAYGFSVADLNGDGFLDIAMARSGARNMIYFGGPA